ncbi:MAG: PEP-CTERM sorting domain-containing protein [Verrucomicrobiota bacterium]|nr:PEP-CTERM sorting domain-containing protein [Verrucomicrobiota bacterium]
MKLSCILTLASCLITTALSAAVIVINPGSTGSSNERGVAFDLTNTSTVDVVKLTGVMNLPIIGTASEAFNLWTRDGTVVGNVGAGATNWTDRGLATATGLNYTSPSFLLTPYQFDYSTNEVLIQPGATLGIWLKDANQTASFRYVSGGSGTVSTSDGFNNGGITYTGYIGLGTNGASPIVANSTFGPTRNFIGTIEYTVVPEPAVYAAMASLLAVGLAVLRKRIQE